MGGLSRKNESVDQSDGAGANHVMDGSIVSDNGNRVESWLRAAFVELGSLGVIWKYGQTHVFCGVT